MSPMGTWQGLRELRKAALKLAGWQTAITMVIAGAAGWLGGTYSAYSALAGGAIGIAAGLYQALRMFSVDAAANEARFMRAVYVSQAVKLLLTAALFVAAIRVFSRNFAPLMIAYVATFFVYWIAMGTGFPWPSAGTGRATGQAANEREDR